MFKPPARNAYWGGWPGFPESWPSSGGVVCRPGRPDAAHPRRSNFKEGAVATVSVYDRRRRRLGTVYLAEMPEAYQLRLSSTLTELLQEGLANL